LPSYPLNTMLNGPRSLSGGFGKEKYMRTALYWVIRQRVVVIYQLPLLAA
jgi:hypothetical protein